MYCQKCGNRLPDDAVFCSKCGAKVVKSSPPPTPPVADTHSESVAKKWLKWIIKNTLKFFIGLVIVMVIPILIHAQFSLNVIALSIQCIGAASISFLFSLPLLIGLSRLRNNSCIIEGFFVIVLLCELRRFIFNEQFSEIILLATTIGALVIGLILLAWTFARHKKF